MGKLLKKEDLGRFLLKIKSRSELIGPLKRKNLLVFETITNVSKINLERQTAFSPKEFLIPKKEVVMSFKDQKIDYNSKIVSRVIFGIRKCDINAITKLDKIYLSNPVDESYKERKEKTTIIGIECKSPEENCFCDGFKNEKNYDLFFYDIGNSYYIDIKSEKGLRLVSRLKDYDYEIENVYCKKKVKITPLISRYDSKVFDEISKKCTSCGRCTLLCPSCNCFITKDEYDPAAQTGKRTHDWTSCMFDEFTKRANKDIERKSAKEKLRHRILHKFDYFFEKNNTYMCTGCGRCITYCPQKIDFTKAFKKDEGGK